MAGWFSKKPTECPVDPDTQTWVVHSLLWLTEVFGMETLLTKKIYTPEFADFPIVYDGNEQAALDTLKIIAEQMNISPENIALDFYSEGMTELGSGGMRGNIFIQHEDDAEKSSGKYFGPAADSKFHISLNSSNLTDPIGLVATIAHELAHVKLLGEENLQENDEPLTDLATIFWGFGIFNANAAFRHYSGFDKWGYRSLGYLNQLQWGYALAAYSALREEVAPTWARYLSATVATSFRKSMRYIEEQKPAGSK